MWSPKEFRTNIWADLQIYTDVHANLILILTSFLGADHAFAKQIKSLRKFGSSTPKSDFELIYSDLKCSSIGNKSTKFGWGKMETCSGKISEVRA